MTQLFYSRFAQYAHFSERQYRRCRAVRDHKPAPKRTAITSLILIGLLAGLAQAQDLQIDLAERGVFDNFLSRIYGSVGNGSRGVPVAGGLDLNLDGHADSAFAAMTASPNGRSGAGQVFVVFGNGMLGESLDSSVVQPRILPILGAQAGEHAGSEIWMDDVTGDGLGDLLICRQDHTPVSGRIGAGALTIISGSAQLSQLAADSQVLDLGALPPGLSVLTIFGKDVQDRFCMWVRTGDVDGDTIPDLAVGADQAGAGASHNGEVYVIRGGSHLSQTGLVDISEFGAIGFELAGHFGRITAPTNSLDYHLGATVQIADLDGNGRAEVLAAAALNRAGGGLRPDDAPEVTHGSGGTDDGTLYIIWDDLFPSAPWPAEFSIDLETATASLTEFDGGLSNDAFGEEILGGLDFDGNGSADLFVGDLTGDPPSRGNGGLGHIFYDAAILKGRNLDLGALPGDVISTLVYGPIAGAIGADTAMQGDFNGDGIGDLAFSSPHDAPFGRVVAGTIHVLFGQNGTWPALIDLASGQLPPTSEVRITEVYGANGRDGFDQGDTLSYSGAAGDMNADGYTDLITNEMVGNGIAPNTVDVGNLILISGTALDGLLLSADFEGPPESP